ncbi:hypothetical protein AB0907_38540 [Streptomyces sp. NPDC006975]|uniref:hypothetical protein n=1 Tax=Streptomyces sp. NPDC006975 TaxID=3154310 RepID=UPI003453F584
MQVQVIDSPLTTLAVLACVLATRQFAPHINVTKPGAQRSFTAVGALLALALVGRMIGSFFSNQYLPTLSQEKLAGTLAWQSHQFRKPDGTCPKYADHGGKCRDYSKRTVIQDAPPVDKMVCEYS